MLICKRAHINNAKFLGHLSLHLHVVDPISRDYDLEARRSFLNC